MDAAEFQKMLMEAAKDMPPPPDVQPENVLRPSPEEIQSRLILIEFRLSQLAEWAKRWDMNFPFT